MILLSSYQVIKSTKSILLILLNCSLVNCFFYEDADTFLFGSKSEFDDLCRKVVSLLKEKYPHIKRIYVRAEYPYINEDYENYLLKSFEETYFSKRAINAGRAVYVKRNFDMIDSSDICVTYYSEDYISSNKSGTDIAYKYAKGQNKRIINMFIKKI